MPCGFHRMASKPVCSLVAVYHFCCPYSRIPQGKECVQGKPLSGFPCAFNQRPPTAALIFAERKSATPKESHPLGGSLLVPRRGFTPQGGINFDSPEARQQKRKIPKGVFLFCDCPPLLLSVNQRFLSCFSGDVVAPSSKSVTT